MAVEERVVALPAVPYRGIRPFRYADHAIFFAREEETRRLASLVAVYRGAMLYGDSGNGKSSLINAGLVPAVMELGFEPVRVRVQPRSGEELVVEQITVAEDEPEQLTSLSTEAFAERVLEDAASRRPLLVFDQFEEIVTLFEERDAADEQARIVDMLVRLLREPVPVKLLFAFREDYLGRIKQLLEACPELVDQALRLGPPAADALPTIISGPFERFPDHFERPFDAALVERLCAALAERFGTGDLSLSEVQTVCLRLWRADDREALLAARGVQGLLEDYLSEALDAFPPDVRAAAIALLAQMITSAGTRNVISAEDLMQRVKAAGDDTPRPLLERALEGLESESRLVRRERRRDLYLYEITSEFLVPWISRRRELLRRQVERRRFFVLAAVAVAVVIVAAIVAAVAIWALAQRSKANEQERVAASGALAGDAARQMALRPDVAMLLGLQAYEASPTTAARDATIRAVQRSEGLERLVVTEQGGVARLALSPDGHTVAVSGSSGTYATGMEVLDLGTGRRVTDPLVGHTNDVLNLAFSPDGRTFASSSEDDTVRLWDIPSGQPKGDPIAAGHGTGVAFTPDGRRVVIGGEFGGLAVVEIEPRRTVVEAVAGFYFDPEAIAVSGDGETVAVGDGERSIRFYSLTGDRLRRKRRCASPTDSGAWQLAFSPDDRLLAWAGSKEIGLFDPRRCRVLVTRKQRQAAVVAFSPSGKVLAAGGTGLGLWSVPSLKPIRTVSKDRITGLAYLDDNRLVSSTARGGVLSIWDLTRANSMRKVVHPPLSKWEAAVALSPDGETLAAADGGRVTLWDTGTDHAIGTPMRVSGASTLAFDPRGDRLAIGTTGGGLSLWDLRTQERIASERRAHPQGTVTIVFREDGRVLASAGYEGVLRLWNADDLSPREAIETSTDWMSSLVFMRDGTIAACDDLGTVRVWDTTTKRAVGAPMRTGCSLTHGLALSPDGHTLAAGGEPIFTLWDVRTHRRQGPPLPGTAPNVAFSADGRTLATAGGSLQLWDVSSRRRIGRAMPGAYDVMFSDDGDVLISTNLPDKGVTVWNPLLWGRDEDALRRQVCPVVGRSLTSAEADEYLPDGDYDPVC